MLLALFDRLGGFTGSCSFDVLTTYPDADAAELLRLRGNGELDTRLDVTITPARPAQLLVVWFPLALLVALLRLMRIPGRALCVTRGMRALYDADIVLDVAGISFVDGRGLPLLGYNFLMTAIPLLLG
jgi:hypothetical protein